tara:strand:+ start:1238 stop:2098 length:861 start_codon:yes stop_codon:yes gene_type:complete
MIKYKQNVTLSKKYISSKMTEFWDEDMPSGDVTTSITVPDNKFIEAEIQSADNLIFVGENIIPFCFDKETTTNMLVKDGTFISKGDVIGKIKGPAKTLLSKERVMLNLIQRLCGIATIANEYASIAKPYNVKILDTRKTTPGLRLFEKYAIAIGGAFNHRLNLSEGILIKDNHIIASESIKNAIKFAKEKYSQFPIEIEVDNINQIHEALTMGVDGFLLDNMDIQTLNSAISLIRSSKNGKNIFIEASGGITIENIIPYLNTDINAISIGAITHSAISKDIKLEFL